MFDESCQRHYYIVEDFKKPLIIEPINGGGIILRDKKGKKLEWVKSFNVETKQGEIYLTLSIGGQTTGFRNRDGNLESYRVDLSDFHAWNQVKEIEVTKHEHLNIK